MPLRSRFIIALFVLFLLLATAAVARLFFLRIDSGETFPPYSSLRSDPLGCMALHNSLKSIKAVTVSRNFRPLSRLDGSGKTLLMTGIGTYLLQQEKGHIATDLERFARNGNRVVISFIDGWMPEMKNCKDKDRKPYDGIWGVLPVRGERHDDAEKSVTATLAAPELPLPSSIQLHSPTRFKAASDQWKEIYSKDNEPVIMERQFGSGSIVIMTDPYLFSNEAMARYRQTSLMAWLLGANRDVVFDEFHLGVAEQGGIMALARRFGLLPFIITLLFIGLLYLWRISIPLVPVAPPERSIGAMQQHDSFSGLVNLLRRSVPEASIVSKCVAEWKKGCRREIEADPGLLPLIEKAAAGRSGIVESYMRIFRLKTERKKR